MAQISRVTAKTYFQTDDVPTQTQFADTLDSIPWYDEQKIEIGVACSDEVTAITTGTAKATFRTPCAINITAVRANLNTASSSGLVTIDVKENGTSIFSTTLTIDATEKTSTTAATAAVISDAVLADDSEITIDIVGAGTGAKGLKVWIIGTRG